MPKPVQNTRAVNKEAVVLSATADCHSIRQTLRAEQNFPLLLDSSVLFQCLKRSSRLDLCYPRFKVFFFFNQDLASV
jgi:hypothetical protein